MMSTSKEERKGHQIMVRATFIESSDKAFTKALHFLSTGFWIGMGDDDIDIITF